MQDSETPQTVWHRASDNKADPVGRYGDSDWGFWDETWSSWYGGYADEAAARTGLRDYVKTL